MAKPVARKGRSGSANSAPHAACQGAGVTAAFAAFERQGWERAAQGWHRHFGALASQAVGPLLDAGGVGAGLRVLDVATGPGYAAGAAAARGAAAIGLDIAAAQVALARGNYPEATFRQGDGEDLPFADASFDAVVLNFGIMHMARPEVALSEARRVLRPGGRLAFTVWAPPEQSVGHRLVAEAVATAGDPAVALPEGPPYYAFADETRARAAVRAAGFVHPHVACIAMHWAVRDVDALIRAYADGTVRAGALLAAQPPALQAPVRAALAALAEPYRNPPGGPALVLPMAAILTSAVAPGTAAQ